MGGHFLVSEFRPNADGFLMTSAISYCAFQSVPWRRAATGSGRQSGMILSHPPLCAVVRVGTGRVRRLLAQTSPVPGENY